MSLSESWVVLPPEIKHGKGRSSIFMEVVLEKNIRKWIIFHCHVWVGFFDWDNNNNNNNMFKTNNMPFGCIWKWSLYPTMATQYVGKMMIEPRPTDSGVCLDHSLRIEQSHSYGDGNVINGPFHTGISRGVRVWCSRVCLAAWSFLVIWIFGIWVCPIAEYIPNPMCLPSCLYHHAPNLMDTTVTKLHRGATILGESEILVIHWFFNIATEAMAH